MARNPDDIHAHAGTRMDGMDEWNELLNWRNFHRDVSLGLLPKLCMLEGSKKD